MPNSRATRQHSSEGRPGIELRDLESARAVYSVPEDDLIGEVMVPAMQASKTVSCMAAFFDSAAFALLAPGLASFINASSGQFRLLISPRLNSEDIASMERAVFSPEQVLEDSATRLFELGFASVSALARHTCECLAYLLASQRLMIRFAYMRSGHLFHPKVWLFNDGSNLVVVHGSSNVTTPGLLWNFEMVSLERPWRGADSAEKAGVFERQFERLWSMGVSGDPLVLDLSVALRYKLLRGETGSTPPTIEEFWNAWKEDDTNGLIPRIGSVHEARFPGYQTTPLARLSIPEGLSFDSGPFAHQGRAVHAWEEAGRRGILALATGSGKTICSLLAATRVSADDRPLLLVIAAPFRPLVAQWYAEIERFGVAPLPLLTLSNVERTDRIDKAIRSLVAGASKVEAAVVTHDYLSTPGLRALLNGIPSTVQTMLIADEVHNLGRAGFIGDPPEGVSLRLGLSATPDRQYDPTGTRKLLEYFGEVVFEFTLAEAIGVCLVPYAYHLHPVALKETEFRKWEELTEQLVRAGFTGSDAEPSESGRMSDRVRRLLIRRRAVLELAEGKLDALRTNLLERGRNSIRHTLVYASDKGRHQLDSVNKLLKSELDLLFHQLTSEESSNREETREILSRFAAGQFGVVTCMRVLDEGVDIPQVTHAYLMASTTVRRQWIQRRGRILRRCDPVNKTSADLHDFVVVPPDLHGGSGRAILRQELERAREFAALASNAGDLGGPFDQITALTH